MYYLFDTDSANLVGAYPTQDAALAAVRHALDAGAEENVRAWALEYQTDPASHDADVVAEGKALIDLSRAVPA